MLCLIVAVIFVIHERMESAAIKSSTVEESVYTSEQLNQPSIEGEVHFCNTSSPCKHLFHSCITYSTYYGFMSF